MTRLPGDPGPIRWLRFAVGFRLPQDNVDWVNHELTDAGWRFRTVLRHLAIIVPMCVILVVTLLVLLPAPTWLAVMMVVLILAGSIFTTTAYADDIRASRLRQHGLDVPDDPDLGHPAH
jgi:archaellum biogenesis protein FlaJ (TadC family)